MTQPQQQQQQTTEDKVRQAKTWRVKLDGILQEMKDQQVIDGRGEYSRHLSLSITHLEDTIMRQGMRLKYLSDEKPYPSSYKPESPVVEPTADGLRM
jgi:hypothetical protein